MKTQRYQLTLLSAILALIMTLPQSSTANLIITEDPIDTFIPKGDEDEEEEEDDDLLILSHGYYIFSRSWQNGVQIGYVQNNANISELEKYPNLCAFGNDLSGWQIGYTGKGFFTNTLGLNMGLTASFLQGSGEGSISKEVIDPFTNSRSVQKEVHSSELKIVTARLSGELVANFYGGLDLSFGPAIDYVVSATENLTRNVSFNDTSAQTEQINEEINKRQEMNSIGFGFNLGAIYEFDNGFGIGIQYYQGLHDLVPHCSSNMNGITGKVTYSFKNAYQKS